MLSLGGGPLFLAREEALFAEVERTSLSSPIGGSLCRAREQTMCRACEAVLCPSVRRGSAEPERKLTLLSLRGGPLC